MRAPHGHPLAWEDPAHDDVPPHPRERRQPAALRADRHRTSDAGADEAPPHAEADPRSGTDADATAEPGSRAEPDAQAGSPPDAGCRPEAHSAHAWHDTRRPAVVVRRTPRPGKARLALA